MILKKIIPSEDYTLITQLSAEEVYKRIQENIEPKRKGVFPSLFTSSVKPYEGFIAEIHLQ